MIKPQRNDRQAKHLQKYGHLARQHLRTSLDGMALGVMLFGLVWRSRPNSAELLANLARLRVPLGLVGRKD
jgi:hypothetical protein